MWPAAVELPRNVGRVTGQEGQSDPNALKKNEPLCNTGAGDEEINNFVIIRKIMA